MSLANRAMKWFRAKVNPSLPIAGGICGEEVFFIAHISAGTLGQLPHGPYKKGSHKGRCETTQQN